MNCDECLGIDITSGGVLCEEPRRAIRKLESNIRLQNSRIKEILDGLESYLDSSIEQVRHYEECSLPLSYRIESLKLCAISYSCILDSMLETDS